MPPVPTLRRQTAYGRQVNPKRMVMERLLPANNSTFWKNMPPRELLTFIRMHDVQDRPRTENTLLRWLGERSHIKAYREYAIAHGQHIFEDKM